jgi:hypothetical protein
MLLFLACRRQRFVISRNAVRRGALPVCAALTVVSVCVSARSRTKSRAQNNRGIIVLTVDKNSDVAKAGIQVGDTITSWAQADREISIASPLDVARLERERGPRGSMALAGVRASASRRWKLDFTPWGIRAVPKSIGAQTIDARLKQCC